MTIPYLLDQDGSIRESVRELCETGPVDESPTGRMRALDAATGWVFEEMRRVLTGESPVSGPVEYSERLRDLARELTDLHERTERAFAVAMAARWSEGGDR